MGKTMVAYRKILAALVRNHNHTNLWYIITTSYTDCMDIANGRDDGWVLQDPRNARSLSQAYKSMVHYHDFLD
jgi:hypothetical protein